MNLSTQISKNIADENNNCELVELDSKYFNSVIPLLQFKSNEQHFTIENLFEGRVK